MTLWEFEEIEKWSLKIIKKKFPGSVYETGSVDEIYGQEYFLSRRGD